MPNKTFEILIHCPVSNTALFLSEKLPLESSETIWLGHGKWSQKSEKPNGEPYDGYTLANGSVCAELELEGPYPLSKDGYGNLRVGLYGSQRCVEMEDPFDDLVFRARDIAQGCYFEERLRKAAGESPDGKIWYYFIKGAKAVGPYEAKGARDCAKLGLQGKIYTAHDPDFIHSAISHRGGADNALDGIIITKKPLPTEGKPESILNYLA